MTLTYAILPHKNEFCVAHLGTARTLDGKGFQTAWISDALCSTMEQAIIAQRVLVKESQVRDAQTKADMRALGLRNG